MDLWSQVLSTVAKHINPHCFDTWFRPILFDGCDEKALSLVVPNEHFKKCLLENYASVISAAVIEVCRTHLQVQISVRNATAPLQVPASGDLAETSSPGPALNPKYTFDAFVVGASNQFARDASIAVAERPAKSYNPLYIYGGVGLGKTHLMHAIGHFIRQRNSKIRLTYMSSEKFMNELVYHIRYDQMFKFRQKYREIDVLLMDDIQFLSGKAALQNEFFHTFNALYDAQKQIVITSDCAPREIPTIEERLHSRFEWGLISDIQPPDLETKIAILKAKAEKSDFRLSDSVALFIAESIRSNIRLLEGALNRLSARAELDGTSHSDIDVGYAREVLKDILGDAKATYSPEAIMRAVANHFGLRPVQLKSKSNARIIAQPRQIAMYLCKQLTSNSLPQIGREFGGKHHTTVLHSIRKIENLKKSDSETAAAINKITLSLR